jgi:hypothetical protein
MKFGHRPFETTEEMTDAMSSKKLRVPERMRETIASEDGGSPALTSN